MSEDQKAPYTPGPWVTEHLLLGGAIISHSYIKDGLRGETVVARCENGDDARLVAAAPDMYEALRDILPLYEKSACAPKYRSGAELLAFEKGYAAIAKAEGRTS